MVESSSLVGDGALSPDQSVQDEIVRIFGEVLRLNDVPLDGDFFALGGHSLTASQVSSRIRQSLDVEVPLSVFFERPTVREIAQYVMDVGAAERPGE
ncbi:phosphopantetheine-binding protein [Streptomyces vinaceus]